jgi:hypothetical protein
MVLTGSSLCRRCGAQNETSANVLRKCEALVTLRHHYLVSVSLDPADIRNLDLESSWVFVKGQNCHDLDFSSKGHKLPGERPTFIGTQQGSKSLAQSLCHRLSWNVGTYQPTLHDVPEEGKPYLQRCWSLKSQINICLFLYLFVSFIYSSGDQINKNEVDGTRGTYGREEKCIQVFEGDIWVKVTIWKTYEKIGG